MSCERVCLPVEQFNALTESGWQDEKQSKSMIILVAGISAIFFGGVIVGSMIAATSFDRRSITLSSGITVPTESGPITSEPFSNKYIRSQSGFWFDASGQLDSENPIPTPITFTDSPQQQWSFNGRFLVNDVTLKNMVLVDQAIPMMANLPSPRSGSRANFVWIFTGSYFTQGGFSNKIVVDMGNYLQLVSAVNNVPNNAIVQLVS